MTQKLESGAALWLQRAFFVAEQHQQSEVTPLHLYYAILTDHAFCADFWERYPNYQDGITDYLKEKILDLPRGHGSDTSLSERLADLISQAKKGQDVLSPETLFSTLSEKQPIFDIRIQEKLREFSEYKLNARYDRKEDINAVRSDLTSDFFRWSGTPAKIVIAGEQKISIGGSLAPKIARLQPKLEDEIYGQQDAIDAVMDTLFISAAGLERTNKTAGSFLFRGPTGCGKTELAKVISQNLGIPLLRYDMAEYSESHSVARLLGSPPGYVGNDAGGKLVNEVNKAGSAVVLLDEIEKAHSNIYKILLAIMDRGVATDGRGVEADFSNVILIMTSNVGESAAAKNSIGFGKVNAEEERAERSTESLKEVFSPEFRNRLDGDLIFKDVKNTVMPQIVGKFCTQFCEELDDRKSIKAAFTEAAQNHLIALGRQTEFGPRDVHRLIERQVKTPVASLILGGVIHQGSELSIDLNSESNRLQVSTLKIPQQAYAVA